MSGARRAVRFSKVVQKYKAGEVGAQDIEEETPWAYPTEQEIKQRGEEVAEERRLLRESSNRVNGLLALGLAAELRAEVELYMDEADARVRSKSTLYQDTDARDARVTFAEFSTYDAEDVEIFVDRKRMWLEVDKCMKDVCVGITVSCDSQRQAIDPPSSSSCSGICRDINENVAQADAISYPHIQRCYKASSPAGIHENLAVGGEKAPKGALPALVRAPSLPPSKPEGPAPAKNRPRPPPPARKKPSDDEMIARPLEQANDPISQLGGT